MVTYHTAFPIAANARGRSHAITWQRRCVVSFIAVVDHCGALVPAFRSPACSRFQAARQPGEQNRACSRRGTDEGSYADTSPYGPLDNRGGPDSPILPATPPDPATGSGGDLNGGTVYGGGHIR
jgi:hypothetical protein